MILGINSDGKKLSNLDGLYEIKVPEPVGEPVIPTPTLSLSRSQATVNGTIGNTVSDATYIYKVGSAPTSETDGTVISGTSFSFTNSSALTVYVVGFMDGYADSDPASASVAQYVPTCATPVISQSGNTVSISCSTSGATIYYRRGTSGSYSVYSGSFSISSSVTVYAYATASGYNQSATTSRYCSYTAPQTFPNFTVNCSKLFNVVNVRVPNEGFPSGCSFTYYGTTVHNGETLTISGSLSLYETGTEYNDAKKFGDETYSLSDCTIRVTGSAPGYTSRTVTKDFHFTN